MFETFAIDPQKAESIMVFAMAAIAFAICLSTYRLIAGPDTIDRIIALDVIGTLAIGLILMEAIRSGRSLFMDIALCMAILLFLSTVAFALYYKKGGHP